MSVLGGPNRLSIDAAGLRRGYRPRAPARSSSPGERTRSPFTDIFPVKKTLTGGFDTIPIPAGFTVPTGEAAWYPLIDVVPYDIFGMEIGLFGVTVEFISTNNADANPVGLGEAAWGTKRGTKAAIVVGTGLAPWDLATPAWIANSSFLPGVNKTLVTDDEHYLFSTGFPPGSYNDAIPFKYTTSKQWQPYVARFQDGVRLQAALVIDGAQAQAGAGDDVIGYAQVQLDLGMTTTITGYKL